MNIWDLLMLYVALPQHGVHYVEVLGWYVDVHIDVDGHLLSALRAPHVDLQMAPKSSENSKIQPL